MTLLEIKSMGDRNPGASPGWYNSNGGNMDYGFPGRWPNSFYWAGNNTSYIVPNPVADAFVVVGFAILRGGNAVWPLTFRSPSNVDQIAIGHDMATGVITVHRGGQNGPVIASYGTSSNNPLPSNVWKYLEVKVLINDTAGRVIVRVDGVTLIDFSGNTANTTGENKVGTIYFQTSVRVQVQDLYILDSVGSAPHNDFLGDVRVDWLPPVGNGESSQLLGSDGDSVDNFLLVDETPANTSDYVGSSTDNAQDLYQVADIPVEANRVVFGVKGLGFVFKDDAGPGSMTLIMKETGVATVYSGSEKALSASQVPIATPIVSRKTTTGNLFTVSEVNAMQVGAITGDGVL